MSGRAAAKLLLEDICSKHGYIPKEVLDSMAPGVREVVVKAMLSKDKLIASSVTTLAKNLYSSNARFVFELLQNCDDNHYSGARLRGTSPYVSFSIHSDRIVMQCNEDGFNAENLTAICNVGKSSKTGAQGYIGEKGIGFKSVFMAAYKAHIQSGDFSFHFLHRNGDSGMGMITPVWQSHDEALEGGLTHITLFLHKDGSSEDLERKRQTIRQQFREIHDTILLFMKNMERIEVHFYNDDGKLESTTTYSIDHKTDLRMALAKTIRKGGDEQQHISHYHKASHMATNLAANENRTYSDQEMRSKAYSTSEVVLAFPLDANSSPLLGNQWIFAFLPVRQLGFKFLIQADFVTQANRQDIVTTSSRNEGLLTGIAKAFIKAVLQFCQHDSLQFQWMRYLPQENGYPWDGFWKSLIDKLSHRLKQTPVLRPARPGPLRLLSDSRQLPRSFLDKNGAPLFEDTTPECYLSLSYREQDLRLFDKYGLAHISLGEAIHRATLDLRLTSSRIKSFGDEDWHSRAADLLNSPFLKSWGRSLQGKVKSLRLLPLRDGTWTSFNMGGPLYYPLVKDTQLEIPLNLTFKVVDPRAVASPQRKQLFDSIGVKTASVSLVREAILYWQFKQENACGATQSELGASLRFLYQTHHVVAAPYKYELVYLMLADGECRRRDQGDIYIRDDHPYGVGELLDPVDATPGENDPGFEVPLLHSAYFQDAPSPPTGDSLPWNEWLIEHFHMRRRPRLVSPDRTRLDDCCKYVAAHRPKKFLGFLQAMWELEGPLIEASSTILDELRKVEVLCRSGMKCPLGASYLPTKHLEQLSSRFLLPGDFFPWLQLETEPSRDSCPPEWEPLGKVLGLGYKGPHMNFLLDILICISLNDDCTSNRNVRKPERVYELYVHLQGEVRSSDDSEAGELIRLELHEQRLIFVPATGGQAADWALPKDCVWESPIELTTVHALSRLYRAAFANFCHDSSTLTSFFSKTVEIPDCDWQTLVDEIRAFKSSGCTDLGRVTALYRCLEDEQLRDPSATELRTLFATEALVYGNDARIPLGTRLATACKFSLNKTYPMLENFFTENLGVQTMTAIMVYDKLRTAELSVEEAKQTIEAFNSFLVEKPVSLDPAPVLLKAVFPVELAVGGVKLLRGSDDFALVDRKSLRDDFAGQAKFLNFDVDETRKLKPFIQWARLGQRYLSSVVKETSSVGGDSSRPVSQSYRAIRRKAQALLSIAVAYDSPRTQSDQQRQAFYALLRNSETLETDKITSELGLQQDGQLLRVEKPTAELHIHDSTDGLKIYVPEDQDNQDVCFSNKLPQLFFEWVMTDPSSQKQGHADPAAVFAIHVVLNSPSARPTVLAKLLDNHGISLVDSPIEDVCEVEEFRPRHVVATRPSNTLTGKGSISNGGAGSSVMVPTSSVALPDSVPRLHPQPAEFSTPAPFPEEYSSLLHKTVDAARRLVFPSHGPFNMSTLQTALATPTRYDDPVAGTYRPHGLDRQERDKQVGAAGELFVFELLSHLNHPLSGFSRENWQSSIRGYVARHPDYSDLKPWFGRETADFVYADAKGTLTSLLIDRGYLDAALWAGARPLYLMEVKATTGPCETPFHMSRYQYRRMKEKSSCSGAARRTREVYVVFRVFNLGAETVGVKVLVNPEAMRERGELEFTADAWAVVTVE